MNQSVGQPFIYTIIAVFIITIFAILIGTMSYFKAYKVNSKIVGIIEKYEGYNDLAISEINTTLKTIGYNLKDVSCPNKTMSDGTSTNNINNNSTLYCVYKTCNMTSNYETCRYGVTTYINIEFPIISSIVKIPVHTETASIYTR